MGESQFPVSQISLYAVDARKKKERKKRKRRKSQFDFFCSLDTLIRLYIPRQSLSPLSAERARRKRNSRFFVPDASTEAKCNFFSFVISVCCTTAVDKVINIINIYIYTYIMYIIYIYYIYIYRV